MVKELLNKKRNLQFLNSNFEPLVVTPFPTTRCLYVFVYCFYFSAFYFFLDRASALKSAEVRKWARVIQRQPAAAAVALKR